MSSIELIFDREKGLFSVPVTLLYAGVTPPRLATAEMFVDTGASVSMITRDKAEELGIQVERLQVAPTGGVTALKNLRMVPAHSGLMIMLRNGKQCNPEVRIGEPLVEKRQKTKGPLVRTQTRKAGPVSLFGLNALRAVNGRAVIDASTDPPTGRIEWDD